MEWDSTREYHPLNYNDIRRIDKENNNGQVVDSIVLSYFDFIEDRLLEHINNATFIIGCVAWLTNKTIIDALESKMGVKIIVNKEEYLNSKMELGQKYYYKCLRGCYKEIPDLFLATCGCCEKSINLCDKTKNILGINFDEKSPMISKTGSILTYGVVNIRPKLHHKFLVFFDKNMEPLGVWTGSYNFSDNSNYSLENAVYIKDIHVIKQYIKEFATIYSYAESSDWKSGTIINWEPNYQRYR